VDDREFVAAFEDRTLPAREFTHRNHVRLAWLYLREAPLLGALQRYVTSLRAYATGLGAATKYHETITWTFLVVIHERMLDRPADSFDHFASENEDLFTWKEVMRRFYREETLASERARSTFVMPDRVAG
jgi:hypothetical protein